MKSEIEQPRDICERTFEFTKRIVKLCQSLDQGTSIPRTLANQLLRSGTSIGANVEEAHGSQSKADFTAKMYISCKEARETHYWLRLLTVTEIMSIEKLHPLIDESNQLVAIVKKSRASS